MPIILEDLEKESVVQTCDPKFFSKDLTGKGSTIGLLSIKNNPANIASTIKTNANNACVGKSKMINGYTEVKNIPMSLIDPEVKKYIRKITYPDLNTMAYLGLYNQTEVYMEMILNAIIIEKTSIPANAVLSAAQKQSIGPNGRKITTNYEVRVFCIGNSGNKTAEKDRGLIGIPNENHYCTFYTDNPAVEIPEYLKNLTIGLRCNLNQTAVMDYIQNYDIYQAAIEQSENWQIHAAEIMKEVDENLVNSGLTRELMAKQVQHIMMYNIPLDLYKVIYQDIQKTFSQKDTYYICKQNLNLLLSDTLYELNNNKGQIPTFQTPNPSVQEPASMKMLSPEQNKAVRSTEPLILVQAGAGSGKSTLILSRMDYLIACGIEPKDITVLSFTNAAADHIKEKNANVHSMTIASMIHEIYSANFTNHELSTVDTIINSIDIYYPSVPGKRDPIKHEFKSHLYEIAKQSPSPNSITNLNNFVEEHYDEVVEILNTIKQTSLELEIIICYQKIGAFIEPPTVSSKYLIIDEVQDNSIFEFIYTLKYVNKHKENLFIVGDCSQTLYEFRAANPRALNILEGSGTFATYQLNVNYRSNQEILDFANVTLRNIEANQYANIQLRANALTPVTEQSFLDKVHLNYKRLNKSTDFKDALEVAIKRDMQEYIESCLDKHEKIAFLGRSRATVYAVKKFLEEKYPDKKIINIMPERTVAQTVMSSYIRLYWDELKFVPPGNIMAVVSREIMDRLDRLPIRGRNKETPKYVALFLRDWSQQQNLTISSWTYQLNKGQLTLPEFLDLVKENMLQYEMQYNAIRQSITSTRNQKNKEEAQNTDADMLLSTIHSAKGLEFDNVIVICENKKLNSEEDKRLYYVAFTRAMKTEYIWAYDTVASPKIETDYEEVLTRLHDIAPAINSPLNNKKNKRVKI